MIELYVNGFFNMEILDLNSEPLPENKVREILEDLQSGDLVIIMNDSTIVSLDALNTPLYLFELVATGDLTYEFEAF